MAERQRVSEAYLSVTCSFDGVCPSLNHITYIYTVSPAISTVCHVPL